MNNDDNKIIGINAKIPAPKPGNWLKTYGSWEGFIKEIHKSIGRDLGGGIIKYGEKLKNPLDKKDNI